jgi:ParB family transcriptional regulator, chromosome partitioning protein
MSRKARKAPPKKAGGAIADRPATKPNAADYVTLKIADLDLKGVGNVRDVDQEGLAELVASIKAQGVLEPVLVRERDHRWELVSGFRRVAASKKAGLEHVPARILELDDSGTKEVQLTENLQRSDLTPLEEGAALKAYLEAHVDVTQEQLGKRLGKSQSYVANRIRLLALPEPVLKSVDAGKIPASHAEVFLQLPKEASPREIKDLLERDIREGQSTAQLATNVRWKSEVVNRRTRAKKARSKARETAKFPTCPKKDCGKPGAPQVEYDGGVSDFRCPGGHYWSPKTGKPTHTYMDSQSSGGERRSRQPAAPKLPVVDEDVPFATTPQDLVEFLTSVDWSVDEVSVTPGSKDVQFHLRGSSSRAIPRGIPSFSLGGRAGKARVGEFFSYGQATDAARRRCAERRDALIQWSTKLKPAPGPDRKAKKAAKAEVSGVSNPEAVHGDDAAAAAGEGAKEAREIPA